MARRRFQSGCLFKRGKRRKVWVARWREDVLREDGSVGRILRSVVLGTVADLPTRSEAQGRLDEELRSLNQGTGRPQATMAFATFVEMQWQPLVLPTLKLSTQHGYKNVLRKHVLPHWRDWRLRDIGRLDIQQWVANKFRQRQGWQTVRNSWVLLSGILETAVEYGYLSTNSARGVKFPPKELKDGPTIIAGTDFLKLLAHLKEPYRTMLSLIAATGLRIGELLALRWRVLDLEHGTLAVRESCTGQVPVAEDEEGPAHDSARTKRHRRPRVASATGDSNCARGFVFATRTGKPMRESKILTKVLQPAAVEAGLGHVTCISSATFTRRS